MFITIGLLISSLWFLLLAVLLPGTRQNIIDKKIDTGDILLGGVTIGSLFYLISIPWYVFFSYSPTDFSSIKWLEMKSYYWLVALPFIGICSILFREHLMDLKRKIKDEEMEKEKSIRELKEEYEKKLEEFKEKLKREEQINLEIFQDLNKEINRLLENLSTDKWRSMEQLIEENKSKYIQLQREVKSAKSIACKHKPGCKWIKAHDRYPPDYTENRWVKISNQ